jgi:hypothetical protein
MATSTLGSGTLVLAGTTSGTTTVTATAVAGTTTLTLPAATDTLVGKATTDTLTNKTLTGAAMNGTLGATTPSTGAFTTLTTTGNAGIGTASPSSRITTSGTTGTGNGLTIIDTDYSNDTHQIYGNNSLHLSAGTGGAGAILFRTAGTERARFNSTGALVLAGGTTTANGIGITFPATQSASTNANTLDDYEEGTWTPNQGAGLTVVGAFSSSGFYTKIGNTVFVVGFLIGATTVAVSAGGICTSNLPFAAGVQCTFSLVNQNFDAGSVGACNGSNVHSANAIAATGSIRFSFTYTV